MTGKVGPISLAMFCAVVMADSAGCWQARAASPETKARSAIAALLAASSLPIDQKSSCHGVLPGIAKPSLGDVLASRLIDLDGGKNGITAHCGEVENPSVCHVTVAHADGEDVSSAEFRFHVVGGRLDPESLVCVLTP